MIKKPRPLTEKKYMGVNHIWVAIILMAAPAYSRTLTEVETYRRCYAHLIGESPLLNDSNLSAVKSGSKSAYQACVNLLERMTINPSDSQGKLADPNDTVAVKGLRNIYNVTNQFVASKRFEGTITNFFEDYASGEDILDNTIVALAYTENILNNNREFKDLFNITAEPKAARVMDPLYPSTFTVATVFANGTDSTPVYSARSRYGQRFFSDASSTVKANPDAVPFSIMNTDNTTWSDQAFAPVAVGELIGISYSHGSETINRTTTNTFNGMSLGFNIHSTVAKGVTGLRPYIAASTNWSDNVRPNLEYMPRRLSQNYLKDFLCREVPVVRETDIISMVSTSSTALPFRKAASCVRCHATLDPMAASFRNLALIKSGNRMQNILHRYFPMPHKSNVTVATSEVGWPAVKDADFYKRPAKGRFYFRTYDGKLIDRSLESHDDLSTAFAETDDAYICFAKKMFKHFTGIEIKMFDTGDAANAGYMSSLTQEDWEYRNFVVKAGLNLKKHQKAKELIKEILQSPIYKKSNMGKE